MPKKSTEKVTPIQPISEAEQLAALLKAGGDPLRLQVLQVLGQNSYGVLELCRILDVRQSGMSHHLKVMATGGLVATRREGNSIFYRRQYGDGETASLLASLFTVVDRLPLDEDIQSKITEVHQERVSSSAQFFNDNAERFQEQQDLIASFRQYGDEVAALLDKHLEDKHLKKGKRQCVVEIGPGRGEFLQQLSSRFEQVIAYDNSAEMLQLANEECGELDNIELRLGDTEKAKAELGDANVAVINMVLHHTPNPAGIMADTAAMLEEGGLLLVTDLCRHDQSWAHEACGDVWLGFEAEELERWATAAELIPLQKQFFALRNGFQIQIHVFMKG
ncbi:MAG: metalloregulator ArsR/SmtB family transcription factor [Cellvibrionaceae bacterium]